jgi:hypothetical protein
MVVGRKADDGSFAAFQDKLLKMKPQERPDEIVFRIKGEELTVPRNADQLPMLHGQIPNLEPSFTYQSPYINAVWNDPVVQLSCGEEEMILDFHAD